MLLFLKFKSECKELNFEPSSRNRSDDVSFKLMNP
jgi:hypothetical protein